MKIRIGSGAGFSGDRIEPAIVLAEKGNLDYLVLECLAERTIALAQQQKMTNPQKGYDPLLVKRIKPLLIPIAKNKIKLITNMGAANPLEAAKIVKNLAQELQLNLKVAALQGDNVLHLIRGNEYVLENGKSINQSGELISANAYLGIEGIVEALKKEADIIITGRVADPSLFLAPMVHEFNWDNPNLLGQGTAIGHLLECAGQLTGGYFMNTHLKQIPRPYDIGFPIAEISADGTAHLTKVENTGGTLDLRTCKEQLLYEVTNPFNYITPDVQADFSEITFHSIAENTILVKGGKGKEATKTYKVSVGYKAFYLGEGEISYAGYDAVDRAYLAQSILENRLSDKNLHFDIIGQNSILENKTHSKDVRLRCAAQCSSIEEAQNIGEEVEALYTNGPSGGGGVRKYAKEVIGIHSILLDKTSIKPEVIFV